MGIKCIIMSLKTSGSVTDALKLFAERDAWLAPYEPSSAPLPRQKTDANDHF